MSKNSQWIELGLADLPAARAARVRVFRLLLARSAQLRAKLDRVLAPTGVTTQQGGMLQWIEGQPEAPTIGAVAAGLGMTHQNVKQIAAALQRKQFLVIEVDASDRRARRLVLTEHHRQFWQQRNPDDFSQVAAWTAALDDDEVATLAALLVRLGGDGEDDSH
jgi:DNA-binding MarR family transcriptional regulator